MYILASSTWYNKLIRIFFFSIDKIVYSFIPTLYNLLISIARTSVLSQSDIVNLADKIYKLLAVFMVFKVTLSLIMYAVNPDDFSDKSKGIGKLGNNIIISLSLLILTPYIFNYAFRLQTIILEDNALGSLLFDDGNSSSSGSIINTSGDTLAYMTLHPFFIPDTSITHLEPCLEGAATNKCRTAMRDIVAGSQTIYADDYISGVRAKRYELMFRQNAATLTGNGTYDREDLTNTFLIDYRWGFSTVVGVIVVLMLVSFCMDVGIRSIKLSFLQLVAPIPIISYVDPKSGKDGMFKKWYEMCFKTYLSLFIRLLALYFAVYIISRVDSMTDVVDGSVVTNNFVKIFIAIGALMFAKQFPKILEGLGIKLDGDGKFFLNPVKKFEESSIGGKRLTGAVGGMAAGVVGGHGFFGRLGGAFGGAARGFATNKGYKGGLDKQSDVNRKLREARIKGAGFFGSRAAVLSNRYGLDDYDLEREAKNLRKDKRAIELARRRVDELTKEKENDKKAKQEEIAAEKLKITKEKRLQDAIKALEDRAKAEIELGHGGSIGDIYLKLKARAESYEQNIGKEILDSSGRKVRVTEDMAAKARSKANDWLGDEGMKKYISQASKGFFDDGKEDLSVKNTYYKNYEAAAADVGIAVTTDGGEIHGQLGASKQRSGGYQRKITPIEDQITALDDEIRKIQVDEEVSISGTSGTISLEDAENIVKTREANLKDEQEQRKLDRETAKNRGIGGS